MFKKLLGYLLVILSVLIVVAIGIQIFNGQMTIGKLIGQLILSILMFIQGRSYCSEKNIPSEMDKFTVNSSESIEPAFDLNKRNALVEKIKSMNAPVIKINEFFDGNFADLGSIGCNLYPTHPGINVFKDIFNQLLDRDDVEAIYAHISEIDPGEDSWPYTDRIYVFGNISKDELSRITKPIEPTEIGDTKEAFSSIPKSISSLNERPLTVLWWD